MTLPSVSVACGRGLVAPRPVSQHRAASCRRPALICLAEGGGRGGGGGGSSRSSRGGSGKGSKSSGGGRGGKGSGGNRQQEAARKQASGGGKQKQIQAEQACLVPSLRTHVESQLSSAERMPEPLWGTFCGVGNGLWCGITAAYSPFTGQAEPLALDDSNKPVVLLHQCCVEQRLLEDDGTDSVVRHVARATSLEGLQREMMQGGQLQFPACSTEPGSSALAECWDEERFSREQEGLVVFDGGSYSLGPAAVGSPKELPQQAAVEFDDIAALAATAAVEAAAEAAAAAAAADQAEEVPEVEEEEVEVEEEGEDASSSSRINLAALEEDQPEFDWTAVVVDHCMQWGGEQRLRIRVTLDTAGGGDGTDLEIQPLRVSVTREAWEGLPGSFTPSQQGDGAAAQQEESRKVRLDGGMLSGSWKVFEVSAVTVDDISLQTGLPNQSTLYSAQQTLRQFDGSLAEDGSDGALLLLPHSCGVQLETLRLDNQKRRGLRVSTHWSPQPDMLITMARLYDCNGRLLEVANSTAIKGQ